MKERKTEKLKTDKKGIVRGKNGGARPGAGRKPKANYSVREIFKQAFDQAMQLEDWIKFIEESKKDLRSMQYIIDQRIGKATQAIELDNKGNPLTSVTVKIIKNEPRDASNNGAGTDAGDGEGKEDNL